MKTKLLLLLLLANFSIYSQTNLVPNGDFEDWSSSSQPDNWFRFFSGFISQSTTAQNGSSSTKLRITGSTNFINSNTFAVQANKTYRVTMYHRVVSGTLSSVELSLYHQPNTFKEKFTQISDVTFSSSQWRKLELLYTSTVAENIEVDIWATGVTGSEILLDNVSVVDINEPVLQYTLIPDVNFENKLISLGIDTDHDGKALTSSVSAITTLDITSSSIANLSGIEDFINLTDLQCGGNKLTTLDLSKNVKLQKLDCYNNLLTSLDFNKNISLTSLKCNENLLAALELSKNILLNYLQCDTDYLTSLDISNNTQLITLICYGRSGSSITRGTGKLTNLDVSQNTLLAVLDCSINQITSLDISQNTLLKKLYCGFNRLPSLNTSSNNLLTLVDCMANDINMLDFSNSPSLQIIRSASNKLTTINISNNPFLTELDCNSNLLSSLDISTNPALTRVMCGSNKNLSSLNLKNGNNTLLKLTTANIMFWANPNLKCIEVDDVEYSEANWSNVKDATALFSTNCSTLGIQDSAFDKASLYPNPTKGEVNINNIALEKATVYNSLGQLVKTFTLNSSNINNTINLSGLPKGVYYVYLINQDAASAKKVIVE